MQALFTTLELITPFLIGLCVLLIPVGIVLAIIFGVMSSEAIDASAKKANMRFCIVCAAGPSILMFLLLSLWGFLQVLKATVGN